MTGKIDDQTALRQYVRDGSQAAFELLVRRHVDWVYSAALRQVRDPASAEDATQAAFILLARKAAHLTREINLSGWLFKVVRYEAKFIERSRRRRQAHERVAAIARRESGESDAQDSWPEIAPVLDEAVAELSEADRKSILLRFHQRMSFADVGGAMNTSEEAARKRVDRAIVKLRTLLAGRGVEIPEGGLTAVMLSGPLVHAAPIKVTVGLAASHAAGSAAMNLAGQTQRLMLYAHLKVAAWLIGIAGALTAAAAAHTIVLADAAAPPLSQPSAAAVAIAPAANLPATEPSITTDTFTGRVLDPDGRPVSGATIWAQLPATDDSERRLGPSATTAADGQFSLTVTQKRRESPYAPQVQAIVHANGFGWGGGRLVGTRAIDLELPPAEFQRMVFGDPTGAPIQGLEVTVEELQPSTGELDSNVMPVGDVAARLRRVTDAAGAVEWPDLPRGWKASLIWTDPRFAQPVDFGQIMLPDTAAAADMSIALRPAGTIRGRVTYGPSGQPAVGLHVRAVGEVRTADMVSAVNANADTDADGRYTLTQLPMAVYNIDLQMKPGDSFQRLWTAEGLADLTLAEGQTLEGQNLVLEKGGAITGTVTDGQTGAPLKGVMIGADGSAHPRVSGAQNDFTDAQGQYLLRVPPGPQKLEYRGGLEFYELAGSERSREVMVADGQTLKVDFQLKRMAPVDVRIGHGSVVFQDGSPAVGARVVFSRNGGGEFYTLANRDGQFTFDANTNYIFHARLGLLGAEPETNQRGNEARLTLLPNMHQTITGKVVDQDGHPISGAKVEARKLPDVAGTFGERITEADGTFQFAGMWTDTDYQMQVTADGYGTTRQSVMRRNGKFEPVLMKLKAAGR